MITLNKDLLLDICNIEVITKGKLKIYQITDINSDIVYIQNIDNRDDEWFFLIQNLKCEMGFGNILNFKDLKADIRDAKYNQEVLEYQDFRKFNNF